MVEDLDYDTDFPPVKDAAEPDSLSSVASTLSPTSPPTSPIQPSSPPSPLSLSASPSVSSFSGPFNLEYPPPPRSPCAWIWRCHLCGSYYPLGATRRCLNDGHYYCSGQGTGRNIKARHRGRACSSVFDYRSWADMNHWRREISDLKDLLGENQHSTQLNIRPNCWEDCEVPSACRYLDTIQDYSSGSPDPRSERSMLWKHFSSPRKRKSLFNLTEGVTYMPPSKVPKLPPDPEPELEPEPQTEAEAEAEPGNAEDETLAEEPPRETRHPRGAPVFPRSVPGESLPPKVGSRVISRPRRI